MGGYRAGDKRFRWCKCFGSGPWGRVGVTGVGASAKEGGSSSTPDPPLNPNPNPDLHMGRFHRDSCLW